MLSHLGSSLVSQVNLFLANLFQKATSSARERASLLKSTIPCNCIIPELRMISFQALIRSAARKVSSLSVILRCSRLKIHTIRYGACHIKVGVLACAMLCEIVSQ